MYLLYFLIPLVVLVASIAIAIVLARRGVGKKRIMATQLLTFAFVVLASGAVLFCTSSNVSAAENETAPLVATTETTANVSSSTMFTDDGLAYIAAALAMGVCAIGGGMAVASGSTAAIGATSEDPKVFGKALIFVALGEGIALYGLLVSILILSKV